MEEIANNTDDSVITNLKPYEVAEAILRTCNIVTLMDTDTILLYKDGVYVPGGESFIAAKTEQVLQAALLADKTTNHFVHEVIGHIKRRTYKERIEFDTNPFVLNLKNGLLNLDSIEFIAHTPNYFSITQLPVNYDPKADCPKIKKFISEILYSEDIATIQEFSGYILWRDYPAQKALLLAGDGSNGKSTYINLLKTMLGITNVSSRGLQELEVNRFAKADLFGKLANLYADLPDTALRSVGIFKMLTGGDPITAEHKFKNPFNYINYAKLIFSTNRIPEVTDDDSTAFFRRWITITFPHTFAGEKEDRNLLQKLTTEEELSGFLNWALQGLSRLSANSWRFSDSRSTSEIRTEYLRRSSPIRAFLMDCVVQKPDGQTAKSTLYQTYCVYCRLHHLPVLTADTIYKSLPKFLKIETAKPRIGGKRVPSFIGFEIKPQEQWGQDESEEKSGQDGQDGQIGIDEYDQSVKGVQPVHNSDNLTDNSKTVRENVLHIIRKMPTPFSDDYAVEQLTKTGILREVAEALLNRLIDDNTLSRDPEGYLRLK